MKNYTFALSADQDFSRMDYLLNKVQEYSLSAIDGYENTYTYTGIHMSLYKIMRSRRIKCLSKSNNFFIFLHAYEYISGKNKSLDNLSSITYLKEDVIEGNTFRMTKRSHAYRFDKDSDIQGNIVSVTLKRNGRNYLIDITTDARYCWETGDPLPRIVGLDWGIKQFYTGSDYSKYDSSHFYSEKKDILKQIKDQMDIVGNDSLEYQELAYKYDCICKDYIAKRTDWQYWFSNKLCKKYDYIFLESLSYQGYGRELDFQEKMRDYGMKTFLPTLKAVANMYGTVVHEIDIDFMSSKTCPCGYVRETLSVRTRSWICPECRSRHDRDVNAAQNIARKGINELGLDDKFFDYLFNLSEDKHEVSSGDDFSIDAYDDIPTYEEGFFTKKYVVVDSKSSLPSYFFN